MLFLKASMSVETVNNVGVISMGVGCFLDLTNFVGGNIIGSEFIGSAYRDLESFNDD